MLGVFIGAMIFVLGIAVGAMLLRPGGALSNIPTTLSINRNAAVSEAGISSDASAATGKLNQTLVNDVLRRLRGEWYGELPTDDKLTDGAIRGMVTSLGDPFTQYVEPSMARLMEQDINGNSKASARHCAPPRAAPSRSCAYSKIHQPKRPVYWPTTSLSRSTAAP